MVKSKKKEDMQPWVVLKTAKVDLNLNKLQNQEP